MTDTSQESGAATRLELRPAGPDDARLLFDWANTPESRDASLRDQTVIKWDHHRKWFAARLRDPKSAIWIVEEDTTPVGQIRFQDQGEGPEIAIFVCRAARHRGIARFALDTALRLALVQWPDTRVIARAKIGNQASRHLFESAGFRSVTTDPDHLKFVYPPLSSAASRRDPKGIGN